MRTGAATRSVPRRRPSGGRWCASSAELMLDADPELDPLAAATPNRNWTLPLLEAAGEHLDYVCMHQYWLGYWQKNAMPDYLAVHHALRGAGGDDCRSDRRSGRGRLPRPDQDRLRRMEPPRLASPRVSAQGAVDSTTTPRPPN